jgi:hypothetical protein
MSGDASGNLSLLSGATTVVAVTSAGVSVTGTLAASGAVSGTTGTFTSTLGVTGAITGSSTVAGSTGILYPLTSGTAVASTSGTSIDFTSIPSWVKRITVMFSVVSTNGTSPLAIQIGPGSFTTSGYSGACSTTGGVQSALSVSVGFIVNNNMDAGNIHSGSVILSSLGSNTWIEMGNIFPNASGTTGCVSGGQVTLSGTLDRLRITTTGGTNTFDAGSVNILYE